MYLYVEPRQRSTSYKRRELLFHNNCGSWLPLDSFCNLRRNLDHRPRTGQRYRHRRSADDYLQRGCQSRSGEERQYYRCRADFPGKSEGRSDDRINHFHTEHISGGRHNNSERYCHIRLSGYLQLINHQCMHHQRQYSHRRSCRRLHHCSQSGG